VSAERAAEAARALAWRAAGLTTADTARKMGLPVRTCTTLLTWAREQGVPPAELSAREQAIAAAMVAKYTPLQRWGQRGGVVRQADRTDRKPLPTPDGDRVQVDHSDDDGVATATASLSGGAIRTLDDLRRAADLPDADWELVGNVMARAWTMGSQQNHYIAASFRRRLRLEVRPLPMAPIAVSPLASVRAAAEPARCVVLGDMQVGHRRARNQPGAPLVPLHDRAAIDACVQAIRLIRPECVVIIGDVLDLAGLSRWETTPDLAGLIQPALDECRWWLAQLRRAAGADARIVWTPGNHDERVGKQVAAKLPELWGVRRAGGGAEVLTLPALLGLDDDALRVEYAGGYGVDWYWRDAVRFTHDLGVRNGGGATVAHMAARTHGHCCAGHTHRAEIATRVVTGPAGEFTAYCMNVGGLCRRERGVVPSGVPHAQDWSQAIGLWTQRQDGVIVGQLLPIERGAVDVWGRLVVGCDRASDIAADTGWA